MYEVSEMWAVNRISVATEHVASAITERLLSIVCSSVPYQPRTGRKAVVAGVQPELHQLGGRIVADTLEIRGWDTLYAGSNTPTAELLRMIHETGPDPVALTLTIHSHLSALQEAVERIRRALPEQRIIVGGQAVSQGVPWVDGAKPQVAHIAALDELDDFLVHFD
jgi:MerR family transcriptional regulator, light-induced transcriptional regulator